MHAILIALLGCSGSEEAPSTDISAPTGETGADTGTTVGDTDDTDLSTPTGESGSDTGTIDTLLTSTGSTADTAVFPPQASEGCRVGSTLSDGEHVFQLDGLERRYIVRLPTDYDPARLYPVVLALHGNGGNITEWDQTTGDKAMRTVLGPDGILVVAEAIEGNWRDYSADSSTWPDRIEQELAYFEQVVGDVQGGLCTDTERLFAMGFSGGGSFSGVLGCRRTDIRAFAAGGAVTYFEEDDCVGASAAWITIGALEYETSRADYRDWWRDDAGCQESSTSTGPDGCLAYDGCDPTRPVHYCPHEGDHVWPAFGSESAWAFFQSVSP